MITNELRYILREYERIIPGLFFGFGKKIIKGTYPVLQQKIINLDGSENWIDVPKTDIIEKLR